MAATLDGQLVVAISSRALFDFEEENRVFEDGKVQPPVPGTKKDAAYMQLQLDRLDVPAKPGVAFSLVKKLLAFNDAPDNLDEELAPTLVASRTSLPPEGADFPRGGPSENPAPAGTSKLAQRVEVVILSRNDPVSGMRVFRSAQHYGLNIQRGTFNRGEAPWRYLKPLHANLFLSAHLSDVRDALAAGVPAAQVYPQSAHASDKHPNEVRIAFDGDAVIFSDEAERVFQSHGLSAFQAHERAKAAQPLLAGPFKPLLEALHRLQQVGTSHMRIRTALVTARSAPAHERAIRTLMDWNIEVDEAMFLGGLAKGEFLREFEPDFFFDDQTGHVDSASQHVPSGHVVSGVSNQLS
ncbi:5'-nucleotidase [Polaromonas eurypsychrophila]|uniref:5'-nucleotidase n=1 Tax=Polaromonas eurypsychrophila TaxID=1614635 RepID=A0A916WFR4_9BURK|nr:5'-nucleotidase [Polaromonas eurypsychrophila]GGA93198.1 5'-nucleotidase [Polaromonas eurypsychrophila]